MNRPLLIMQNISVSFGATKALSSVNLQVQPGEVHALIGENGAGKSTLMNVLAGVVKASGGEMFLAERPYRPANPGEARLNGVAMIHQELAIAPHLSVEENICLGAEPLKGLFLDRKAISARTRKALDDLGFNIDPRAPAGSLSISDQQLVEIARASVAGAKVLILDEPTSSLTREDSQRLFALVRRLKEQGMAILYISHFLEEVKEIADNFTVLRDGATVGEGALKEHNIDEIVSLMLGRNLGDLYVRSKRQFGKALLSLSELSGEDRLKSATLQLRAGEVLGVFGLVGCGRTDLLRTIFALDKQKGGTMAVGTSTAGACAFASAWKAQWVDTGCYPSPALRWRQGLGMVSEDRKEEGLATSMTIAENLALIAGREAGSFGMLNPQATREIAARWKERLRIKCNSVDQKVTELSGGNQQKIALARLLHRDVEVMLLDEPTRGIDVGSKRQIYELIDEAARRGRGVLIVSSYLPELLGICDRIAIMNRGNLVSIKDVTEVTEHGAMLEATSQLTENLYEGK